MAKFILYTCPVGPLAAQIDAYFERAQQQCGPNAAHAYMPHCTITGFFEDEAGATSIYLEAIAKSLNDFRDRTPHIPIDIKQLSFQEDWHGLVLKAEKLKEWVSCFAAIARSPTRLESLRLKDWLHLSLAYGFLPGQAAELQKIAEELVDPAATARWELRFYQRADGNHWIEHGSWQL
ncbi:MAG: hypothetical protein AAFR12_14350 [Cyanobacteria bacterium J06626_6]